MFTKQLKVLAILANSDGEIDEREMILMEKIGKAHDMTIDEIHEAINNPGEGRDLSELNEDENFELLYDVIQLMKIDQKIYNEEVLYCQNIAIKLGDPLESIMEIYPHINSHVNLTIPGEKAAVKRKLNKILNK
jgi:hypothetical protein